jgi:hypothetical protein
MNEQIPQQPNLSIFDYLNQFNKRQVYINIKTEIIDKDQTRLYIEMKNKKLITNKQDTTFILAKENAEQAKK